MYHLATWPQLASTAVQLLGATQPRTETRKSFFVEKTALFYFLLFFTAGGKDCTALDGWSSIKRAEPYAAPIISAPHPDSSVLNIPS